MRDRGRAQRRCLHANVTPLHVVAVAAAHARIQEPKQVGHRRTDVGQTQQHHRYADDGVKDRCYFARVCLTCYVSVALLYIPIYNYTAHYKILGLRFFATRIFNSFTL